MCRETKRKGTSNVYENFRIRLQNWKFHRFARHVHAWTTNSQVVKKERGEKTAPSEEVKRTR